MAFGLALRGVQNIHPRTYVRGVMWYGVKAVGEGVSELRIDYGPGYRVYYKQRGQRLIVLLAGGDKPTQKQDIKRALEIARDL